MVRKFLAELRRRAGRWIPSDQRWRLASASIVAVASLVAVVSIVALLSRDGGLEAIYPGGESRYDRVRPLDELPTPVINPYFITTAGEIREVNSSSPIHVRIPSLGVDAPVVTLGLDAESLPEVPDEGGEVAWYDFSEAPGQGSNAVMAGHVTLSKKPAVFWALKDLWPGDEVNVITQAGNDLVYRVFAVYLVDTEDPESVRTIEPAPFDVLTLVTCGGKWRPDEKERFGGSFRDRVVVQATLYEVDGMRYDVTP